METDDPNDGAIREGDPPYLPGSNGPVDTKEDAAEAASVWIGATSLSCACVAWSGICLLLDVRGVFPLIFMGGFWLVAVLGGVIAIGMGRGKIGCVVGASALLLAVLLPAGLIGLVQLVGNGWLD